MESSFASTHDGGPATILMPEKNSGDEMSQAPLSMIVEASETIHRALQEDNEKGRTILTVLYLCVLGLCFVVPVFYYFRMHCEERTSRRIREMEIAGMTQAMEQSQNLHREESKAARRKYREERRARIIQLFAPVRMLLKEEHFPHLRDAKEISTAGTGSRVPVEADTSEFNTANVTTAESGSSPQDHESDIENDIEKDGAEQETTGNTDSASSLPSPVPPTTKLDASMKSIDEDLLFIEVSRPGFQFSSPSLLMTQQTLRSVPNVCSICLSNYNVGNQVVWSSNAACEHVFHEECILQWLMKQREGPLCPCCRRDFVVDPYDMEGEDEETGIPAISNIFNAATATSDEDGIVAIEDLPTTEESVQLSTVPNVNTTASSVPIFQQQPSDDTVAIHMEEGLSSNSSEHSAEPDHPARDTSTTE